MTIPNSPVLISLLLWAHIAAGASALVFFLVPLLTRKGGKAHVKTGWIYSIGMLVVSFSALAITPWRYFLDPARSNASKSFALFLFFIAVFSLTTLQQGLIVFAHKKRVSSFKSPQTLVLPVLLAALSVAIFVYGLSTSTWLFLAFSPLALRTAYKQIMYWTHPPKHQRDWWFFHLENMFVCCIATITAFAVTAVPRIFPSYNLDSIWIWLTPTAVMIPWMLWFNRKHERQFGLR